MAEVGWGAYGFRITGFDRPEHLLVPVPPEWEGVEIVRLECGPVRRRPDAQGVAELWWDDREVTMWTSDTDSVTLDRASMRLVLTTRRRVDDEVLSHPYLGLPLAVANRWRDRQVLHGGAVVLGGRAWCVLGTKEAGKSSTVAWFAGRDHPVLSDDLLVIDGDELCAAPRCVDLREPSAGLGGIEVQLLPGRRRWRVSLGPVPSTVPLGGLVYLEWGDEARLEAVAPTDRIVALFESSVLGPSMADAAAYLDLATLPTWRLVRPHGLEGLDDANAQLRDLAR